MAGEGGRLNTNSLLQFFILVSTQFLISFQNNNNFFPRLQQNILNFSCVTDLDVSFCLELFGRAEERRVGVEGCCAVFQNYSSVVARDVKKSIKASSFSLGPQQDHTIILYRRLWESLDQRDVRRGKEVWNKFAASIVLVQFQLDSWFLSRIIIIFPEFNFFNSLHIFTNMIKTVPQAIDYPYPTTNTPPMTTHRTLIVCEALLCVCPGDDERDAKENDWDDVFVMSDQFSRIKLRNATILVPRRQRPSTNALDWLLYFPCVDRMLEARWVEGYAESLPRHTCVWQKSCQGLPFTHDGVGYHPMERWLYIGCLFQGGGAIPNPFPFPSVLQITYTGVVYMFIWIWFE